MESRRNEIQVGIVTIVSLTVLIVGMMWFKQVSVNRGVALYQVDFPTVEGLQVGDRIQVRGIRAGQVEGFEIIDEFVRVGILIDDDVKLFDDAAVTLGTKGIVGEVVIEIVPGSGRPVAEGHIFQGRTAASITEMTDAAGTALAAFEALTTKLDTLMGDILADGRIVETLAATNQAVGNMNALMEENREATATVMANLESASGSLKTLMDSGKIDQAFDDASSAAARADSLMTALEASASSLEAIMAKIDEGDGTAARMINDPALYEQTHATMASLQRLLDEMRRNPKKYFKLNVF
jgi:phospholipid/cholesterol/gamma-HCH transport system substrate-binding protein